MGPVVFVVGAASLGTEIAAARLLAPWFGASTIIWANTIATVLLALSVGYAVGGRLADRRPSTATLGWLLLVAGALLTAVPFVSTPLLRAASGSLVDASVQGFLGSLGAVLALTAVPLALIGAVTPLALRLSLTDVASTGRTSGRLSAISTAGGLVGTFLSALVLIPFWGTRRTFVTFGVALVVLGAVALWRRVGSVAVLAALLLVVPDVADSSPDGRVLQSFETQYQHVRVVETPRGSHWLELNEGVAVHSVWRPDARLTGGYWDDPLVLPLLTGHGAPRRVAVLGAAAGTVARATTELFPGTTVDAVEIDGALAAVGERYFDLRPSDRLHLVTADARPFIRADGPRYDAVLLDAYRQPYIPFQLVTREFFAEVADRLEPGGVLVVNVGHTPGSDALERVVVATLRTSFPHVLADQVDGTNVEVVASREPLHPSALAAGAPGLPPELDELGATVAGRLRAPHEGDEVYTDDRAPVEWLVDGSLLHYAIRPPED